MKWPKQSALKKVEGITSLGFLFNWNRENETDTVYPNI